MTYTGAKGESSPVGRVMVDTYPEPSGSRGWGEVGVGECTGFDDEGDWGGEAFLHAEEVGDVEIRFVEVRACFPEDLVVELMTWSLCNDVSSGLESGISPPPAHGQ